MELIKQNTQKTKNASDSEDNIQDILKMIEENQNSNKGKEDDDSNLIYNYSNHNHL